MAIGCILAASSPRKSRLEASASMTVISSSACPSSSIWKTRSSSSRKTLLLMTPNWMASEWTDFEAILTQTGDPVGRRRRARTDHAQQVLTSPTASPSSPTPTSPTRPTGKRNSPASLTPSAYQPTSPSSAQLVPNLVHPYALQANFTGRMSERKELTAWLADDARSICALIAMGGMGKSALAWYWVTKDVLPDPAASKVEGVMWWSFYEGEASFAKFVDDALKYVSGQPIDAEPFPTTYDRAQELRKQLQTQARTLRLRRIRAATARICTARRGVPARRCCRASRDARACVEPDAARLLQTSPRARRAPRYSSLRG